MRNKFKVYPYKMGSKSAQALAKVLGCKQIKHEGKPMVVKSFRKIINWGGSRLNREINLTNVNQILNHPDRVIEAGNKLTTFQELSKDESINLPPWTTDKEIARTYGTVVCRTVLNGHSGRGIVVADSPETVVAAPLYTGYVKKAAEFRVHVVNNEVIDVQQKKKSSDFQGEADTRIRNHQNGWVYCRENLEIPEGLHEQAIKSVSALGLDFGAVDIIYNRHHNKCYVLEVNTAPGLEGSTVEKYAAAFKKLVG
jgi:glutathione synthase/RimK-type ligase-like ATP-grasp enzyme